jgi:branched-chain amino acid transport system ATP-binding protein
MNFLSISGLYKRFGGLVATDNLDLDVAAGEVHAVIGPNGAGKTTLINQLSGIILPDRGRILFAGVDVTVSPPYRRAQLGIARSFQITSTFPELSVLQNVMLAVQGVSGHSFSFWKPVFNETDLLIPAREALTAVGLSGYEATTAAALAHGARRQLEIAMTLAMKPKLLLLDEPMAGMSHNEAGQMVGVLRSLKSRYTMLLIEHDMDVVFALADRITVLVYGRALATGTPDFIRNNEAVRDAYLGDQDEEV